MKNTLVVIALVLFSSSFALAQVTQEQRQAANKLYQASDWEKAADAYKRIVEVEPTNANANFRLGMSSINLGRNAEAIKHLDAAFTLLPNPIYALNLARAYARSDNKAKAFETIEKANKTGGISPDTLTSEKDFSAWLTENDFKELVRKADLAVNPCKASPEFRQFDFWIGEWDVKSPGGQPAGSSSVQLILGQCIIFENWTSGAGSNGKSFNIFDVSDKKWHQTYVDDKGTFSHYIGGLVNGEMVITAENTSNGKKTLAKMTFSKLPNGDVRQHGENSTDDGKTWTTTFDLTYSKKK